MDIDYRLVVEVTLYYKKYFGSELIYLEIILESFRLKDIEKALIMELLD